MLTWRCHEPTPFRGPRKSGHNLIMDNEKHNVKSSQVISRSLLLTNLFSGGVQPEGSCPPREHACVRCEVRPAEQTSNFSMTCRQPLPHLPLVARGQTCRSYVAPRSEPLIMDPLRGSAISRGPYLSLRIETPSILRDSLPTYLKVTFHRHSVGYSTCFKTRATALVRRSAIITRPGKWRTSMTRRATKSRSRVGTPPRAGFMLGRSS